MLKLISALFLSSILWPLVLGHSSVVQLTAKNFDEETNDGRLHLVKFYAPWCGHCKRLIPVWEELGESFKDDAQVAISSVDCTKHRTVCDKAAVRGFPTIMSYYGGAAKEQYKGARTLESLRSFTTQQKLLNLAETVA